MLDHKFERQLIEDYLIMFPGQTFDPMTTIRGVRERWGIRIDWHEGARVLRQMCDRGDALFIGDTGPDNFPRYVIQPQGGR